MTPARRGLLRLLARTHYSLTWLFGTNIKFAIANNAEGRLEALARGGNNAFYFVRGRVSAPPLAVGGKACFSATQRGKQHRDVI